MESFALFRFGPFILTQTVITTWGIMSVLTLFAWLTTHRLFESPSSVQTGIETCVELIYQVVHSVLPEPPEGLISFIGTLWIFIAVANLVSVIPGLKSPTSDLSLTSGLAFLVFCTSHWFGIRSSGLKNYLREYLKPNPVLLPFHIISEFSRTLSLAMRLFGNMMSLEIAAAMVLMLAGFLLPIPLLMLHVFEALVQAYIFGLLALVYISSGIQSRNIPSTESAFQQGE